MQKNRRKSEAAHQQFITKSRPEEEIIETEKYNIFQSINIRKKKRWKKMTQEFGVVWKKI